MTAPEAVFLAGLPRGSNGELPPGHTTWDMLGPKGKTRYETMAAAANEAVWSELADVKKRLASILSTVSYTQHNEALACNTPLTKFAQAVINIIEAT